MLLDWDVKIGEMALWKKGSGLKWWINTTISSCPLSGLLLPWVMSWFMNTDMQLLLPVPLCSAMQASAGSSWKAESFAVQPPWRTTDRPTAPDPLETHSGVLLKDNTWLCSQSSNVLASYGQAELGKLYLQGRCSIQEIRSSRMLFTKSSASAAYYSPEFPGKKMELMSGGVSLCFQVICWNALQRRNRKVKPLQTDHACEKPSNNLLCFHLL